VRFLIVNQSEGILSEVEVGVPRLEFIPYDQDILAKRPRINGGLAGFLADGDFGQVIARFLIDIDGQDATDIEVVLRVVRGLLPQPLIVINRGNRARRRPTYPG